jgi:hypothetical protein
MPIEKFAWWRVCHSIRNLRLNRSAKPAGVIFRPGVHVTAPKHGSFLSNATTRGLDIVFIVFHTTRVEAFAESPQWKWVGSEQLSCDELQVDCGPARDREARALYSPRPNSSCHPPFLIILSYFRPCLFYFSVPACLLKQCHHRRYPASPTASTGTTISRITRRQSRRRAPTKY